MFISWLFHGGAEEEEDELGEVEADHGAQGGQLVLGQAQCTNVQVHNCTGVLLCKIISIQVYNCQTLVVYNCTSVQVFKCTGVQ